MPLLCILLVSALPEFCAGLNLVPSSDRQPPTLRYPLDHQPQTRRQSLFNQELTRRHTLDNQQQTRRHSLFIAVKCVTGVAGALTSTAPFVLLPGASRPALAANLPYVATSDLSKVGTVDSLLPIITLLDSLQKLKAELQQNPEAFLQRPLNSELPASEQSFKEIFDSYSDPVSYKQRFLDQNAFLVYYTRGFDGPGRPSIDQDVNVRQTQQYGYRNEAWVAYEEFLSEIRYSRQHPEEFEATDVLRPLVNAIGSIEGYLTVAPAEAVLEGRRRLGSDWQPMVTTGRLLQ
jgi:hypothetical protein